MQDPPPGSRRRSVARVRRRRFAARRPLLTLRSLRSPPPRSMTPRTWRQWHRWIGFPAAVFLLFAAVTGITLVCVELFSADEAERERLRTVVSPVVTVADAATVAEPFQRAFATAARQAPGAPVDKVEWQCKAEPPTVTLFLGKPSGGEDRR